MTRSCKGHFYKGNNYGYFLYVKAPLVKDPSFPFEVGERVDVYIYGEKVIIEAEKPPTYPKPVKKSEKC